MQNSLTKTYTIYAGILVGLQLWLIFQLPLFGDESFYWLEGQHLALSYSELPGWTAWMIRLGTSIFGHNYFAVRITSYVAYLSIFVAFFLINSKLNNKNNDSINYFIVLALPLLGVIAVLALPDIWLVFFVIWIIYFFLKAIKFNKIADWLLLGLLLACSMNVHVRMWIWLFFAGLSLLICFRSQPKIIKSVLLVTLPVSLLGLVPVLIFNFNNEFGLFVFQFGQRHPWNFQIKNLSFLLSQIIVISPVILFLWLKNLLAIKSSFKSNPLVAWILITALLHWVFYIFMSLFADGLRTTVHWLLVSYIPVLVISSRLIKNTKLINFAIISGGVVSLLMLFFLVFNQHYTSNNQSRVMDNFMGWHELAETVERLQKHNQSDEIIADYFMTASELAFEMDNPMNIKVLPHTKNNKHGRKKQLEIMNMLIQNPKSYKQKALLVIEDSGLKLQNKGEYYIQMCDYFRQFQFLESVNVANSQKQFHVFKVNNDLQVKQTCDFPPLFYAQYNIENQEIEISGWSIMHNSSIQSLSVLSGDQTYLIKNDRMVNNGISALFPEINDSNLPNNAFIIKLPLSKIKYSSFKLIAISNNNKKYLSQNYIID